MKRSLSLILAAALVISMAGCGDKKDTKDKSNQETTAEAETPATTIQGTLKTFTGGNLTMTSSDNQELSFDLKDATLECKEGMAAGDPVTLTYEGTITGTDTSKAKVIKVTNEGVETLQAGKADVNTISGKVVTVSSSRLSIDTDSGKMTFSIESALVDNSSKLKKGDEVSIDYIGDIKDTDTDKVHVVQIKKSKSAKSSDSTKDENDSKDTKDSETQDSTASENQEQMAIAEVNETVYAVSDVYVRSSYDKNSGILGTLRGGESVTRTGNCANGWCRVTFNGGEGYIYQSYLTTSAPSQDNSQEEAQPSDNGNNEESSSNDSEQTDAGQSGSGENADQ